MNERAKRHVTKAANLLGRGEEFYRKAALEMRAAKDEGATWNEIGDALGRGESWCRKIVAWAETAANQRSPDPFGGQDERARKDAAATRKTLRDAPLEQVEQIVAGLPRERQQAIAAAAGNQYLRARLDAEDDARLRPSDERRERDDARERLTKDVRHATGDFASLGIVGHLEQATEDLREMQADASLTPQAARKIERALDEFVREFDFARALLGENDR